MGHYDSGYNFMSEDKSFKNAEHRIKLRSNIIKAATDLKRQLEHNSLKGEIDLYHASVIKDLINDMLVQNISDKAIVDSYGH